VTFLFTRDLLWTPAQDDPASRSGLGPDVKPPKWLGTDALVAACLGIGLLTANPGIAQAGDVPGTATIEQMQRQIERLRQRIETLEERRPTAEPPAHQAAPPAKAQGREKMATPAAPAAAPAEIGAIETTQEEVERALERALVQTGALLLPAGTAEIEPNFSYVRQETDAPVFFTEDGQQSFSGRGPA
jgi:hypothetical protein